MANGPWGPFSTTRYEVSPADSRDIEVHDQGLQQACENCSAVLAFAPGTQELECQYCGHRNEIEVVPIEIVEHDLNLALNEGQDADLVEENETVTCQSCQASFTFDSNIHAGDCPFCGQSIVTGTGRQRLIKPAAVLPFVIEEARARARVNEWLRGLWFAPSGLKKFGKVDGALHGVYLPYWTYDSDTRTAYTGQRGDIYYEKQRVRVMVDGKVRTETQMVQKVRWRPASGRVSRHFDDVLVLSSKSLPEWMTDRLPWDLGGLTPYSPHYLAGFQAESYQVGLREGFSIAHEKMSSRIKADIRISIGGDLQRIHHMDVEHKDPTFKHILLPLWLGAFRYSGRSYHVCVNGQNGEVQGERPYSAWKIALLVFVLLVLAGMLALAAQSA